ncbi:MAG: AMP-binding protein [Alphaproteobacteria bacterium]|nr:AMP-binding protein [Alphaproteobacteria bacterium]
MPSDNDPAAPEMLQALACGLASGGDRDALVWFDGGEMRRRGFADLARDVDRRARWLAGKGVRAGDTVLLCGPGRADWIVAFLALQRCGACAAPVDAQFAPETFAHVLRDSGARLVLAAPSAAERFAEACKEAGVETADLGGGEEEGADEGGDFATVEPADHAVLFYTSGTTGPPKGVPLTHRNIAFQIRVLAEARLVAADDRVLLPLPLHHVYPLVIGVLVPLALRVAVVLPDGFTGTRVLDALRRGRVTLMIGVPRLYDALVDGIENRLARQGLLPLLLYRGALALSRGLRRLGLRAGKALLAPLHRRVGPSLRAVISGGSALKPATARTLEAMGWRVGTGYGLTETSPLLSMNPPGAGRLDTAGLPVPGVELCIDREAGDGSGTGEVLARGPGVFAGYRNLEDRTKEVLTGDGWFRTGDLGHIDADGYLHLAGRKSTLIVTPGGENVQPDEIEDAYAAHTAIAEIAVLEADGRIVGLIVPDPSLRRDGDPEEAVRRAVRAVSRDLPSYQRLAEYRITGEAIPRTRLGKPRRHLIEARYRQSGEEGAEPGGGAPEPVALDELSGDDRALLENEAAYAAFLLVTERSAGRRVTPDSDLQLDLGIDSIEWLDLSLALADRTGVTLSEEAIAEIDTLRDLLERVAHGGSDGVRVEDALSDPEAALDEAQRRWLEPPGRLAQAVARVGAAVNGAVMRRLFRLRVQGLENLPDSAPFVLAPNHASYLDPFALAAALGTRRLDGLCWAGWTGVVFTGPVRRAFARVARALPIDPAGGTVSSLAFGSAALKRGLNLVWFPEGARSPDGALKPFRPGIGMVLKSRPVSVVPVAIRGTHDAWPPSRRLPRLRPVSVAFLPPVEPAALAGEGEGETEAARIAGALHRRVAEGTADPSAR